MGATVSITRLDLTASEVRKARSRENDGAAARAIAANAETISLPSAARLVRQPRYPRRRRLLQSPLRSRSLTMSRPPAYAPEPNPIEDIRECLRGVNPAITVFDDQDDIVDKANAACNDDLERTTSITER